MTIKRSVPLTYKLGAVVALAVAIPSLLLLLTNLHVAGVLLLFTIPVWVWGAAYLLRPLVSLPELFQRVYQSPETTLEPSPGREVGAVTEVFRQLLTEARANRKAGSNYRHLFDVLFDAMPSGGLLLDEQGHVVTANRAFSRLSGYGAGELSGADWNRVLAPRDSELVSLLWQELQGKRDPALPVGGRSLRIRCKEGAERWIEISLQMLTELHPEAQDARTSARFLVLMRDISEQKQALDLLHLERRKALTVLDKVSDAVMLTDDRGRVQYMNPVAAMLTVQGPDSAAGQPLDSLIALSRPTDGTSPAGAGDLFAPGHHQGQLLAAPGGELQPVLLDVASVRDEETGSDLRVVVCRLSDDQPLKSSGAGQEATHDSLTGLSNRAAFHARLEEYVSMKLAQETPTVVALVDLDHFRQINEQGGRVVGDQMLKQVARILLHNVRRCDLVARLGADEFGLLLTGCDSYRALLITEGIRADLEKYRLEYDGESYGVTASIGVTELTPGDTDVQRILRRADEGCYRSKAQGRNLVNLVETAA